MALPDYFRLAATDEYVAANHNKGDEKSRPSLEETVDRLIEEAEKARQRMIPDSNQPITPPKDSGKQAPKGGSGSSGNS